MDFKKFLKFLSKDKQENGAGSSKMEIVKGSIVRPLPSDELLAEKEQKWNLVLPMDYKNFIKEFNGCEPKKNVFMHNEDDYGIERFLCILKNARNSKYGEFDISVIDTEIGERLTANEDLIGIEVLPIAELYGGDMVCLDFRKTPDAPAVCLWDSAESDDFAPVTYEIAKSFTEFCGMLYEE